MIFSIDKFLAISLLASILSLSAPGKSGNVCAGSLSGREVKPSRGGLSIVGDGNGLNLWSDDGTIRPGETAAEKQFQIDPDRPVVIGRGGQPDYLDPKYIATTILPDGGPVVGESQFDLFVSRGHFMLKYHPEGIIIQNGVPRPPSNPGIRPPRNGTRLLSPENRPLRRREEFLVRSGTSAKLRLPNGTILLINAE